VPLSECFRGYNERPVMALCQPVLACAV
jgi:hypothetical protein